MFLILFFSKRHHTYDTPNEYCQSTYPMDIIMQDILNTARSKNHIQGNKKLQHHHQQPKRHHIRWPKQKKRLHHIKASNQRNNKKSDIRGLINIVKFMQLFLVFFGPELGNQVKEYRIKEDDNKYQHIPVILGFVNSDHEAVPLKKQGDQQKSQQNVNIALDLQTPAFENEIS